MTQEQFDALHAMIDAMIDVRIADSHNAALYEFAAIQATEKALVDVPRTTTHSRFCKSQIEGTRCDCGVVKERPMPDET